MARRSGCRSSQVELTKTRKTGVGIAGTPARLEPDLESDGGRREDGVVLWGRIRTGPVDFPPPRHRTGEPPRPRPTTPPALAEIEHDEGPHGHARHRPR